MRRAGPALCAQNRQTARRSADGEIKNGREIAPLKTILILAFNPRYPGLAHRGPLRRTSRYDPFGTLS
ncbi:hypothetical protein BSQ97_05405 [Serratia proteamaculans]|nr:hypothetical protein F8R23_02540 [Serratia proteamaculans]RYM52445.1 hypothetical protein BSQ97_05405 [Serratia proteamaculans]